MISVEYDSPRKSPVDNSAEPGSLHRTRGGTSYQHSLSARGIKTSGRARSCSSEDLLASLDRLERATRLPSFEDEETDRRRRSAFGRRGREGHHPGKPRSAKLDVRRPHLEW